MDPLTSFCFLLFLGLCQGQQRSQELTCYECAWKGGNNTCTSEFRKSVKALGFDIRCRVMEMNGLVVSQGIVPKSLCTHAALARVNQVKHHLQIKGKGDVFPYCCNSDLCNLDMCTAMGLSSGHNLCTTTIEHKLIEQQKLQQLPGSDLEILSSSNNKGETLSSERPSASLQAAGSFGGGLLSQKSGSNGQKCISYWILFYLLLILHVASV